jgi:3-keto-L-gulonate-6-phosphate decarboxylase
LTYLCHACSDCETEETTETPGQVRRLKAAFPESLLLADLKIMDAGEHEAGLGFGAGADIVTVLSAAHDETIRGCVRAARRSGGRKEIMVPSARHQYPARNPDLTEISLLRF